MEHDGQLPRDGLEALVSSGVLDPGGLIDPWGNRYVLIGRGDDFEIATVGPDHRQGTVDDFTTSSSDCPAWPVHGFRARIVSMWVGIVAVLGLGLVGWGILRRHCIRIPRTTVN